MDAEDFHSMVKTEHHWELQGKLGVVMTKTHCTWMITSRKINKDRGELKADNFHGNERTKFHKGDRTGINEISIKRM